MWPGILEKGEAEKEERKQKLLEVASEVKEHFLGQYPISNWITSHFPKRILLKTGIEFLTKTCYCEYCENYTGVAPLLRKRKNISVICGYCKFHNVGVTHDYRCEMIEFKKVYKENILQKLKNLPEYNEEEWYKYKKGILYSVEGFSEDPDDELVNNFGY